MIEQIRKMYQAGVSNRKIARSLGISRNTVSRYLNRALESSQTQPAPVQWQRNLDWSVLINERKKGASVKALYDEYQPQVDYSTFAKHLKARIREPLKPAIPLDHVAGERTQVDYCDGLKITDPRTGKTRKTHFFCGVLPFSSLTFGEFVWDQKLESFIRSHEKMWSYFGGVTPYVVLDNLKSGVKNAHRWDPDINPTYCDFGHHSGFAALPARPYTPRDKASIEAAIGAIQRSFFQTYRNHVFYSLDELNRAFRTFLDEFNDKIMPDHGVSRRMRFEHEKGLLRPLARSPYEIAHWAKAKVHPDCCIQVAKALYSVPFQYCGQTVRVKTSQNLIEIFDSDLNCIAIHNKVSPHSKSIIEAHLPPHAVQQASFQVKKAISDARDIGPRMSGLIEELLTGSHPYRYLRRVQGILRLAKYNYTAEALEYAASKAMSFRRYQLSYIKSCADHYQANGGRLQSVGAPKRDPKTIHLHGD
jgi:transposase